MTNITSIFKVASPKAPCLKHEQADYYTDLLTKVTVKTLTKIHEKESQLKFHKKTDQKALDLQNELNHEMQKWNDKVKRIGVEPLGLFRCRLTTERGAFLWEYPKKKLEEI